MLVDLKKRLWARLIERLAAMQCQEVEEKRSFDLNSELRAEVVRKETYEFFTDEKKEIVAMRIVHLRFYGEESYGLVIQLLDPVNHKVLAWESFAERGPMGGYLPHPLMEVIKLVNRDYSEIDQISFLAKLLI